MSKRYVHIEPCRLRHGDRPFFIDTQVYPVPFDLALAHWLDRGESFDLEDVENDRMASAVMSDYGTSVEEASEAVHAEVTEEWVELLNWAVSAGYHEDRSEVRFGLTDMPGYGDLHDTEGEDER